MEDSTRVNQLFIGSDEYEEDQDQDQGQEYHEATDGDNGETNGKKGSSLAGSLDTVSGLSSCSSPLPPEPFTPRYSVQMLPNSVSKDGEVVMYSFKGRRLDDGHEALNIKRQYEDFEYLHHCLTTAAYPGHGLIVPPLPPKPAIAPELVQETSKAKLGSSSTRLISDEWHKDCWHLQQYLKLMLSHPTFGRNEIWDRFLGSREPPARVRVKGSGLMSRISDSFENRGKESHRDCDEFFQKERDWINIYSMLTKQSSEAFDSIIYARLKLCGVLAHFAAALNLNLGDNESKVTRMGMKFCHLFSLGLDDYRKGLEVINFNDEATIGSCLELWSRYLEAEKEMLYKRTCLLIDYENSNRLLDKANKAKPNKVESAEQTKLEAEKAFEDCSDIARCEIKRFHRARAQALGAALEKYSESQLLVARDVYSILKISVDNLKNAD